MSVTDNTVLVSKSRISYEQCEKRIPIADLQVVKFTIQNYRYICMCILDSSAEAAPKACREQRVKRLVGWLFYLFSSLCWGDFSILSCHHKPMSLQDLR